MKILVLTFSTNNDNPGLLHLQASLDHYGYDYEILVGPHFSWGGDNYVTIADWLRAHRRDYTHILYTDAWDTISQGPPEELLARYTALSPDHSAWIYSGEKNNCFCTDWLDRFTADSRWRYLCAGGYIAPIDLYLEVVQREPRPTGENDQVWGSRNFAGGKYNILLDTGCVIFQTLYNFHQPSVGEYIWQNNRLSNLITKTQPLFIHGDGKVDMRPIYHDFREYLQHVQRT